MLLYAWIVFYRTNGVQSKGDCLMQKNSDKEKAIEKIISRLGSPAQLIEEFAALEERLGIKGILDFYNAPVQTFALPERNALGQTVFTPKVYEGYAAVLPSFMRCVRTFERHSNSDLTYVLVRVGLLHGSYVGGKSDGIEMSMGNSIVAALAKGHPYYSGISDGDWIAATIHGIRGQFEYGTYGVVVAAIPSGELDLYFSFFAQGAPQQLRVKNSSTTVLRPEHIVEVVSVPTKEEKMLLDEVLRSYWIRLLSVHDYYARRSDILYQRELDPYTDPIPREVLPKLPQRNIPEVINLGGEWGARGMLEGWHRLAKINKIIAAHKKR